MTTFWINGLVMRDGSSRGDYTVQFGSSTTDDVATGVLILPWLKTAKTMARIRERISARVPSLQLPAVILFQPLRLRVGWNITSIEMSRLT
jgi:hypothetical protein